MEPKPVQSHPPGAQSDVSKVEKTFVPDAGNQSPAPQPSPQVVQQPAVIKAPLSLMTVSTDSSSKVETDDQSDSSTTQKEAVTDHLQTIGLKKSYHKHRIDIPVLQGVDLSVPRGAFVSIVGTSGSGKSTLLHLLGTLDKPDSGKIMLNGKRIDNLSAGDRDQLRNKTFGYIFQFYHLLPEFSVLENVSMPGLISHSVLSWLGNRSRQRKKAMELLDRVGLGKRLRHKPRELSGGEMQRAAIARALISSPEILLADEPTGNLDADTGGDVLRLLLELNRQDGLTIIMVTHNKEMAQQTGNVLQMVRGKLVAAPEGGQHASSGIERLKLMSA